MIFFYLFVVSKDVFCTIIIEFHLFFDESFLKIISDSFRVHLYITQGHRGGWKCPYVGEWVVQKSLKTPLRNRNMAPVVLEQRCHKRLKHFENLHRWRWSTIRWFWYFFHFFYTKLCLFEKFSSILVNLLFSKLNNILQVLQSIFIVWCFDQFKIKCFWNRNSLITCNTFFYLHPHQVCSLDQKWVHFYLFFV